MEPPKPNYFSDFYLSSGGELHFPRGGLKELTGFWRLSWWKNGGVQVDGIGKNASPCQGVLGRGR